MSAYKETGKCCLCGKKYEDWGHNAMPLKDGRCCAMCNAMKVIPTRMERYVERAKILKKEEVKKILAGLEKINPNEIVKRNKYIDFEKLKKHPKVKEAVKELNEMGVTRNYLWKHFMIAGMLIGRLLKK